MQNHFTEPRFDPGKFTIKIKQFQIRNKKLRYKKKDNNLLLLKTDMGAGHSGPTGRFEYLKEIATEYGFILKVFNLTKTN